MSNITNTLSGSFDPDNTDQAAQPNKPSTDHPVAPLPDDELLIDVYDALAYNIPNATIENTTTHTELGTELVLSNLDNVDWTDVAEHEQYAELFPDTQSQVKLYRTGVLIVSGPADPDRIVELVRMVHGEFRVQGVETTWHSLTVRNIVASFNAIDSTNGIDLAAASLGMPEARYDPQHFPGLIHADDLGNANVYNTGRILVMGVTDTRAAERKHEQIVNKLETHAAIC